MRDLPDHVEVRVREHPHHVDGFYRDIELSFEFTTMLDYSHGEASGGDEIEVDLVLTSSQAVDLAVELMQAARKVIEPPPPLKRRNPFIGPA